MMSKQIKFSVLVIALTALLIGGAVSLAFYQKNQEYEQSAAGQLEKQIASCKTVVTTPKGTTVKSQNAISSELIAAIDRGFDEMEQTAADYDFTLMTDRRAYTVLVFPSERDIDADGNYNPAFKVPIDPANAYWGSQYDKGGYILAAERVINPKTGVFVIVEYKDRFDVAADATLFALEHTLLFHNNHEQFLVTRDHLTGGHRILPRRNLSYAPRFRLKETSRC